MSNVVLLHCYIVREIKVIADSFNLVFLSCVFHPCSCVNTLVENWY